MAAPILPVHPLHPEPRKIARAAAVLEAEGVIALPTDTVYALGCELGSKRAIERIYRAKGLDRHRPLSFLCPDLSQIARYAVVSHFAYRVMRRLLPGPYTFVLEATREVPRLLLERRRTVGIRVPDHPVTQALIRALGRPIVSTSAQAAGGGPLYDVDEIKAALARDVDLIVDGGPCGREPSTIVVLLGDEIVIERAGKGPIDGVLV